jgi:hypothetical protein
MKVTTGGTPYAIGRPEHGRFHVRAIRFGKLAASYELRPGEEIRIVTIVAAQNKSVPCKIEASE